jgi:lysophospholipase L1-like esterase
MIVLSIVTLELVYLASVGQVGWLAPSGAIAIAVGAWFLTGLLQSRGFDTRWFLSLAVVITITVVPELGLRAIDFRWGARVSDNGLRPEATAYFESDKDLLWKRSSDEPGVNELGFVGPEISDQKPDGVVRVVILGDSCAEQDYATILEQCLNSATSPDATRFECCRLACAGYSSYQGKVIAETAAAKFAPDIAVVCYGWNDHWLAYRATDEELGRGRAMYPLATAIGKSRLVQLGQKLRYSLVGSAQAGFIDEVRVSADQYRDNLLTIVNAFEADGIPVVFMTAPSAHYRTGVPDYIVDIQFARTKQQSLRLHREYNQIVRDIAAEKNLILVDLEAEFDRSTAPSGLFKADGIHFTPTGLQAIGQGLCSILLDGGSGSK